MEVYHDKLFIEGIVNLALEARLKRKLLLTRDDCDGLEVAKYTALEQELLNIAMGLHQGMKLEDGE